MGRDCHMKPSRGKAVQSSGVVLVTAASAWHMTVSPGERYQAIVLCLLANTFNDWQFVFGNILDIHCLWF